MTCWTLENNGVEKTLENWGIDDLKASFTSQDEDVVELSCQGRAYDAAYLFPFYSTCIIRRDRVAEGGTFSGGSQYFVGLVTRPHCAATGRSERQGCALVGPWWYLNERGFEQSYKIFTGFTDGDPHLAPLYEFRSTNRIFLNLAPPLPEGGPVVKLTTGEQLTEILTWTLKPFTDTDTPPPFQIGTIGLAVDPPIDEVKNITCGEAARKMFRWSPDAVAWFDYTTEPPTFHAVRRGDLASATLDLSVTRPVSVVVTPRPDIKRPYVKIIYEITQQSNGSSWLDTITDLYPPVPNDDALSQFTGVPFIIDLRGFARNQISVALSTETIAADTTAWWLKVLPEYAFGLANGTYTSVDIDPASVIQSPANDGEVLLGLPNRLVAGTPADWIPAQFQRVKVSCKARIKTSNNGEVPDETLRFAFTATDATSGAYTTGSTDDGDPVPRNLARDFYTALSEPFFEGAITFQGSEVGGLAGIGKKLNLAGTAQAAWGSMNAIVQRVTESLLHGVTTIDFGHPEHLNLGDLVSLFWVTRSRNLTQSISLRSGRAGAGGGSAFSAHTAHQNSASGRGNAERIVASGSTQPAIEPVPDKQGVIVHDGPLKKSTWVGHPSDGSVTIAIGHDIDTAMGKTLVLRETRGCDPVTGAPRYCMMLRSEWYVTPLTVVYDE